MDWEKESEGDTQEASLAPGYHKVKVKKAIRIKKDGTELKSAKGPFLMLIFADVNGLEATNSYWLTKKAGWKLALACKIMGFDLARMTSSGIEIESFCDEGFAKKHFEGRECLVQVTQQGVYTNAEVVDEDSLPPDILVSLSQEAQVPAPAPTVDDDIPF